MDKPRVQGMTELVQGDETNSSANPPKPEVYPSQAQTCSADHPSFKPASSCDSAKLTDTTPMLDYVRLAGLLTGNEILIMGLTSDGKPFRPSDWCERLCGVMSQFKPPGRHAAQQHLAYSPYCLPKTVDNIKCVVVDVRLRDLEPKALNFVLNFAKDNGLQVIDSGQLVNLDRLNGG